MYTELIGGFFFPYSNSHRVVCGLNNQSASNLPTHLVPLDRSVKYL